LRAAVVVGSAFDVALLGELVGISPERSSSEREPARQAGILAESGDGYEFSNDLIREILYDTTPKPLRRSPPPPRHAARRSPRSRCHSAPPPEMRGSL
jgi:hypothetical protein